MCARTGFPFEALGINFGCLTEMNFEAVAGHAPRERRLDVAVNRDLMNGVESFGLKN